MSSNISDVNAIASRQNDTGLDTPVFPQVTPGFAPFRERGEQSYVQSVLRYLSFGRIVVTLCLLLTAAVLFGTGSSSLEVLELAAFASFGLLYGLIFLYLSDRVDENRDFALIQVFCDICLIGVAIARSGGMQSVFTIGLLIVVVIVGAVFEPKQSYFLTLTSVTILTVIALLQLHSPPNLVIGTVADRDAFLSNYMAMIMALLGTVILVNYLSAQVQSSWIELRAERAMLEELRNLHEDVVYSIPSGIITTDTQTNVTFSNQATEQILRMPPEALQDKRIEDLFGQTFNDLAQRVLSDENVEIESTSRWVQSFNQEWLYLEMTASKLWHAGEPRGLLVVFDDRTAMKRMEERVQRQNQLATVGRMAAGIAHEIRNPLSAISNSMQMLTRTADTEDATTTKLLEIVTRETKRLDGLVEDFLGFARPQALNISEVDPIEVLEEVLLLLKHKVDDLGSKVTTTSRFSSEGMKIRADSERLKQVFWNLCLNAVQAMGVEGELALASSLSSLSGQDQSIDNKNGELALLAPPGANFLRIDITDTGPGIPIEETERIFQPFHSKKSGGLGLGLAVCRKIVEAHGGSVTITSTIGKGTTFTVHLPIEGPSPDSKLDLSFSQG